MTGANAYHCAVCGGLQDARRQDLITHLPPILMVVIQRQSAGDLRRTKALHPIGLAKWPSSRGAPRRKSAASGGCMLKT